MAPDSRTPPGRWIGRGDGPAGMAKDSAVSLAIVIVYTSGLMRNACVHRFLREPLDLL